jgi:PAS domain S-box-containing protein
MAPSLRWGIAAAGALIAVETLAVCVLNAVTGSAGHFGTLYLLGVLVISTLWGYGLSVAMSIASAIAFAYFRNWPDGHFAPFASQTWFVMGVFLMTALVANWLARLARVGERFFDLSSDLMCITSLERVIRVNPAFSQTVGYTLPDLSTRSVLDLVAPEDRGWVRAELEQLHGSAKPVRFENRLLCSDESQRWIEWSVVWDRGLYYAVGRDMTEHRLEQEQLRQAEATATASRDELKVLAELQAALRRVATLVARGAAASEVFSTVAEELACALNASNAALWRYESDGTATLIAAHDDPRQRTTMPVGSRWPLEGDNIAATIRDTGRPARMDTHDDAGGWAAARIRELGLHAGVGAPIVVEGRLWGAAVVGTAEPRPLPPDIEARVTDFADLVATAIANATTRDELIASRARIVVAADDARRRLERDLHDGAQQRLVSLGLQLRLAEDSTLPEQHSLRAQLAGVVSGLTAVSTELQEISRGIHPAILSRGGLGAALKVLARRCPIVVDLDTAIERRLPDPVEVTAYYVVAEALTNAAKYAQAAEINVSARTTGTDLELSIADDGIGGADSSKGSGLIGLKDRVEVLGGRMKITSRPGSGTTLDIVIPLDAE